MFLLIPQVHAQTVQSPPWVHQQFLSTTGAPLSGACIYTYSAGTTTPLATFTDSTASTPNANPTQADAGGFVNLWLQSGVAYKFIVWSNPTGACPGTPTGQMALQWTVDGITTATASGSGAASLVLSTGANPAAAGPIIRMTKSDTIAWRNANNSQNLPISLDSNNNLIWAGLSFLVTEGTNACANPVVGLDGICADQTAHRLKAINNGTPAVNLVVAGVDVNSSDQVTVTHLAAALPTAQGGTGSTSASTGSGGVVLATGPAVTNLTGSLGNGAGSISLVGGIAHGGTGFQHMRFTTCTTSAGGGACASSATWPTAFADTNYTATCTLAVGANNGLTDSIVLTSLTTTGFNYQIVQNGTGAVTYTAHCMAAHD